MRIFPAAALLLLGLASSADARAAEAFPITSLAPGVFVHLGRMLPLTVPGHDDIANLGFVIGARCVAVIDTGGSVRVGRALRAAIAARTPLPVCYVIDTHVHVDHVLGNAAFEDDHPKYVGHAQLAAALARSRELFLRDYAGDLDTPPAAAQIIGPDIAVRDTLELDLGGRRLALRAWPAAHTDCDLTVFDSASGTLFAGDLLFRDRIPAVDASALGWLRASEELEKQNARRIVPGHGSLPADARAAFAPEQRYLHALVDGVRAGLAHGEPMSSAIGHVALGEKAHWQLWDTAHAHNVARVYQELEWE